jgi:hypothetical protein
MRVALMLLLALSSSTAVMASELEGETENSVDRQYWQCQANIGGRFFFGDGRSWGEAQQDAAMQCVFAGFPISLCNSMVQCFRIR